MAHASKHDQDGAHPGRSDIPHQEHLTVCVSVELGGQGGAKVARVPETVLQPTRTQNDQARGNTYCIDQASRPHHGPMEQGHQHRDRVRCMHGTWSVALTPSVSSCKAQYHAHTQRQTTSQEGPNHCSSRCSHRGPHPPDPRWLHSHSCHTGPTRHLCSTTHSNHREWGGNGSWAAEIPRPLSRMSRPPCRRSAAQTSHSLVRVSRGRVADEGTA